MLIGGSFDIGVHLNTPGFTKVTLTHADRIFLLCDSHEGE
jgi:hypothetical protein